MNRQLWEILVPRSSNDGAEYALEHHRVWDEHVREISGGLTILKPAKGHWRSPDSVEYRVEEVIPVRILCTRPEIEQVIELTLSHYDQRAVLAYRISDEVILKRRDQR